LAVDHCKGTNYSAKYSIKGLVLTMLYGALFGGLGWGFSVFFQSLHLTALQYVGLSVFCLLIGLDLKAWSYFAGKNGDVLWSAILGATGDASLAASGAALGAGINVKNSPLGLKDIRVNNNAEGSSESDSPDGNANKETSNPYDLEPTHSQTKSNREMNAFTDKIRSDGYIKEPIKYVDIMAIKMLLMGIID